MAQVVRGERRHARPSTRACERHPVAVGSEPAEHGPFGDAVVAGDKREHVLEQEGRRGDPAWPSRLRRGDTPPAARLVDVPPGERLKLADAHPGRVEHEGGEAVDAW